MGSLKMFEQKGLEVAMKKQMGVVWEEEKDGYGDGYGMDERSVRWEKEEDEGGEGCGWRKEVKMGMKLEGFVEKLEAMKCCGECMKMDSVWKYYYEKINVFLN